MKKNNKIMEYVTESSNLNSTELHKYQGQPNDRVKKLIEIIQTGQSLVLRSGEEITPKLPNESEYNQQLIQVLSSGDQELIDEFIGKGRHNQLTLQATNDQLYKISDIKKTAEFGGGSASKSNAKTTAAQEAIQAMAIGYVMTTGYEISADDVTPEILRKGSNYYSVGNYDQASLEQIYSDASWRESTAKSANAIVGQLHVKGMVMHHDSPWVRELMALFKRVNRNLETKKSEFSQKDKWNPADIWAVQPNVKIPNEINDLKELKGHMQQWYEKGEVYGISLKKVGTGAPSIKPYNVDDNIDDILKIKIDKLLVSDKHNRVFANKHAIIRYESTHQTSLLRTLVEDNNTITTRTNKASEMDIFSEITGKAASHGKVGYTVINKILVDIGIPPLTSRAEIKAMEVEGKTNMEKYKVIIKKIVDNAAIINPKVKDIAYEGLGRVIENKNLAFLMSKYQAVELLVKMHQASPKNSRDILQRMFRYASSRSELSSVFIKIS